MEKSLRNSNIIVSAIDAEKITDLLLTLEAMAGVDDDEFNEDCKNAGLYAKKIRKLLSSPRKNQVLK